MKTPFLFIPHTQPSFSLGFRLNLSNSDRRFDSWKDFLLSRGSRLTLIKSSLANIMNYFLLLLMVPISVTNKMELKFRNLWNDLVEHHRYHLIGWNMVCRPLREGGLGIRRIRNHNRELLGKWLWKFGVERNSLGKSCGGQVQ